MHGILYNIGVIYTTRIHFDARVFSLTWPLNCIAQEGLVTSIAELEVPAEQPDLSIYIYTDIHMYMYPENTYLFAI